MSDKNIKSASATIPAPAPTPTPATPEVKKESTKEVVKLMFDKWAFEKRIPSWKVAAVKTKNNIVGDKILTEAEFEKLLKN